MKTFRPPAVPLITSDPYFNIWSFSDNLYDDYTRHWTGKKNALAGMLKIDGVWRRFTQKLDHDASRYRREAQIIPQKSVNVSPLTTRYIFQNEKIKLTLDFMTPLLPDDLYLISRPVSYIDYKVESADENEHELEIYFDISAEAAVDSDDQEVCFGKSGFSIFCGRGETDMLTKSGDDMRIDWGYLHLIAPGHKMFSLDIDGKRGYIEKREYKLIDGPCAVKDRYPALCCARSGKVEKNDPFSGFVCVGYDDIKSIDYFGKQTEAYWRKDGESFEIAAARAVADHGGIQSRVKLFESDFIKKASLISEKYCDIVSLAYRQVIAAHKLTFTPEDGEIQFCSKECYSNGCMATVDLTYPSMPLFLLYNSELLKGMLNPIFKYAASEFWSYDFAPHDIGQYPLADGQRYGYDAGSKKFDERYHMRVEESGNMILCVAALCSSGDLSYAKKHFKTLDKWADYLAGVGWDPENQLCTDDFAGHLAHNCNLSVKGILAVAAWGSLLCKMGKTEEGALYRGKARELAKEWKNAAYDKDHYKLAFDRDGSWSIKYNLVWDRLLDLGVFDTDIAKTEIEFYKTKINAYGLPLDIRSDYTKSDWQMWSAALTDDEEYAKMIICAMWEMLCDTDDRVPFTDWYFTSEPAQRGFQNRSVQGGLFIKLL